MHSLQDYISLTSAIVKQLRDPNERARLKKWRPLTPRLAQFSSNDESRACAGCGEVCDHARWPFGSHTFMFCESCSNASDFEAGLYNLAHAVKDNWGAVLLLLTVLGAITHFDGGVWHYITSVIGAIVLLAVPVWVIGQLRPDAKVRVIFFFFVSSYALAVLAWAAFLFRI
jgi:hypothetical protein